MNTPTQTRLELADLVHELTEQTTYREHYTIAKTNPDGSTTWHGRDHLVTAPSLIHQLHAAVTSSGSTDDGMRSTYSSRSPARDEAIDAAGKIYRNAARWVRRLGEDDPADKIDQATALPIPGTGAIACVRKVHALAASTNPLTRNAIEKDVRRWWTWARIATGWDLPAWSPDATCPHCEERGTLRVRLAHHIGTCLACETTWEPDTIGLLADHIRSESHIDPVRSATLPCYCPLPRPTVFALGPQCPACGYTTCAKAADTPRRRRDVG